MQNQLMTTRIQISTGTDVLFHNEMQHSDSLIWRTAWTELTKSVSRSSEKQVVNVLAHLLSNMIR